MDFSGIKLQWEYLLIACTPLGFVRCKTIAGVLLLLAYTPLGLSCNKFKVYINTVEVLLLLAYNPLGFIMYVTIEGVLVANFNRV